MEFRPNTKQGFQYHFTPLKNLKRKKMRCASLRRFEPKNRGTDERERERERERNRALSDPQLLYLGQKENIMAFPALYHLSRATNTEGGGGGGGRGKRRRKKNFMEESENRSYSFVTLKSFYFFFSHPPSPPFTSPFHP